MMIRLIAVLAFLVLVLSSTASGFEVSSTHPGPGDTVTIAGNANPGQEVKFQTSFQMNLPVVSGRYEYEASSVQIPQKPNRFAVTIDGVKDLNVGVKIGIWISKGFNATNGKVSLSQSDVPPGKYDLKVFGDALDGRKSVSTTILAETAVKADSGGKYSLSVDTSGIPIGAYKIEGAGETKTIQVGGTTDNVQASSASRSAENTPSTAGTSESNKNATITTANPSKVNGTEAARTIGNGSRIPAASNETAKPKVSNSPSLIDRIRGILGI